MDLFANLATGFAVALTWKNLVFMLVGIFLGVLIGGIVLSILVGIVMSALGIRPENLLWHLEILVRRIYNLGFGAIGSLFSYFLIGALVVLVGQPSQAWGRRWAIWVPDGGGASTGGVRLR